MYHILNRRFVFFRIIFLILFCGNIALINGGYFESISTMFDSLNNILEIRNVNNYKVYFSYNIIMFLIFLYFFIFIIPKLKLLKLSMVETFVLFLLLYRGVNDVIVSYISMEPIGIGYLATFFSFALLYISIIFTLRNSDLESQDIFIGNLVSIFIISGVINSVVIIFQFFNEYFMYYSAMGFVDALRFIRPISLMGVVTVNSMFIGFSIIFLISKYKNFKGNFSRFIFYLLLIILFLGEAFTSSRGGFLVLIVTAISIFVINFNRIKIRSSIFLKIPVILFVVIIGFYFTNNLLTSYLDSVFLSNSASASNDSRFAKWELAIDIFKQNPAFGVGTGNYNVIQENLTSGWSSSNPHNVFLQLLSENGWIYTTMFFGLLVYLLLKYQFKLVNSRYYSFYIALIYWFLSSFYMSTLDNMILGMCFVTILAVLAGINKK